MWPPHRCPVRPPIFDRFMQALGINVGEILNDYGIYAMFHELLREAGELCTTVFAASGTVHTLIHSFTTATCPGLVGCVPKQVECWVCCDARYICVSYVVKLAARWCVTAACLRQAQAHFNHATRRAQVSALASKRPATATLNVHAGLCPQK